MNFRLKTLSVLVLLSACDTYGDYRDKPSDLEFHVNSNYQAVYARMLSTMRSCLNPGKQLLFTTSSSSLDSDLFPDLGYGELVYGLDGLVPDTLAVVRIAKDGAGSKVSIKTGNMIPSAASNSQAWLKYWANGGSECQTGLGGPPAS